MKLSRVVMFTALSCTMAYASAASVKTLPRTHARIMKRHCVTKELQVKLSTGTIVHFYLRKIDDKPSTEKKCENATQFLYYKLVGSPQNGKYTADVYSSP